MKLNLILSLIIIVLADRQLAAEIPAAALSPEGVVSDLYKLDANMGHKTEITFLLVLTKAGWKVSDIKYADGRHLIGFLSGK